MDFEDYPMIPKIIQYTFFNKNQGEFIFFINFFYENLLIKLNFPTSMDFSHHKKSISLMFSYIRKKKIN